MDLPLAPFGEIQTAEKSLLTYISFHYNINTELATATVANNGTVTQSASAALLKTSATSNGSAILRSRLPARYIAGQGLQIIFSAMFGTGIASNLQEAGYGNTEDGLFFEYNGETFGVNRRSKATGEVVNNRKTQAEWSEVLGFEFNPLKLNIYAIEFQWLGAGEIDFLIENPHTRNLHTVHRIKYTNSETVASLLNPSLPIWMRNINSGSVIDTTLKIGNAAAYVFGKKESVGIRQAYRAGLAYTTGAERTVLAIENMADVFGGTGNNRSILKPTHINWSTDGTKIATLRVKRCTISGGTAAVINVDTSIAKQYTGTPTVSNTKLLFSIEAAKDDQDTFHIPDDVELAPGEAIIVTAESTANSDLAIGISWKELL